MNQKTKVPPKPDVWVPTGQKREYINMHDEILLRIETISYYFIMASTILILVGCIII